MLVEDNDDHAELVSAALEVNNLVGNVVRFADAETGLDYLYGRPQSPQRTAPALPDLILLDLMLPGMSGMELLKVIRNRPETKGIPVVVLTTSAHDQQIARAYEYGANSYIAKPVGHQDFVIKLAELNMFWSVTAELPRGKQNSSLSSGDQQP
ncbi:MAG: response regulator [Candidatus Zixiibacteriota bacterium]|nr:MAG: response regulator [candidate division Zixibacteria bacterium]